MSANRSNASHSKSHPKVTSNDGSSKKESSAKNSRAKKLPNIITVKLKKAFTQFKDEINKPIQSKSMREKQ